MRLRLERRPRHLALHGQLVEVITPRTNVAALTSAENLFAAVALPAPLAFEIAADAVSRRFLVRAAGTDTRQHVEAQLAAAYPQADLRPVASEADPARPRPGEHVDACWLGLRSAPYLPIRTFADLDLDPQRAAQSDPLLAILAALGGLPPGWRAVTQLVLRPAAEDWCRDYARFAVQHPLVHEQVPRPTEHMLPAVWFIGLLLGLAAFGLQGLAWYRAAQWLPLGALIVGVPAALAGAARLGVRLLARPMYDMQLVRDKVTRVAYHAELRLAVFAPAGASPSVVRERLARVAAAYRHFNLAAGNGFRARPLRLAEQRLASPLALIGQRRQPILTTRELAGLWHLPHAADDVALLERTRARRWLPLPATVAHGCRIGVSTHQGRQVPVAVPPDVLGRHLLLVAKTRRGKSTLMLRLAHHAMLSQPARNVVLIDPHTDLAQGALELVPPERHADVVYIDAADTSHPVGLNVLDVGLGWQRDQAVASALAVFRNEWGDRFWGPRMEDAFRFALLSLFEANAALCAADPRHGRAAQYTLLDVPPLLTDARFRQQVLGWVSDAAVRAWWTGYFDTLDRRFQSEIINPILSKIHRFEGTRAARQIVGQPASTIRPTAWLSERAIVVVNTARGQIGDNAAALIGSTLLNLVSLAVAHQSELAPAERQRVSIFVDEFHTIPGADYELVLSELSKFGASLTLATQSLARLVALGGDAGNGLRATVFANLDGLFAFNCSAEDAEYLVPELGGLLDTQDLVELGEHQCYVRLSSAGQRLPTFWVSLDPPLASDPRQRAALVAASAARYGRAAELVEADRRSALARLEQARAAPNPPLVPSETASGRNQHRPRKNRQRADPSQGLQPRTHQSVQHEVVQRGSVRHEAGPHEPVHPEGPPDG